LTTFITICIIVQRRLTLVVVRSGSFPGGRERENMRGILLFIAALVAAGTATGGGLPFSHWGVLDTPSASILVHSQFSLGGAATSYGYDNPDSTSESDFALCGYLEAGLFNMGQIGVTYLGAGGISGTARFLLMREDVNKPGIAIGCENITGTVDYEFWKSSETDSLYNYDESQNISAYIVLSKSLKYFTGVPFSINLGYGIGRFRQRKNDESDGILNPFPGLFTSFVFNPSHTSMIAFEWDGRDLNIGGSYRVNKYLEFRAAIAEVEQFIRSSDLRDPTDVMQSAKFTLGLEVTLGPFISRTTLEPTERLSRTVDSEALRALEEARRHAKEDIRELEASMP